MDNLIDHDKHHSEGCSGSSFLLAYLFNFVLSVKAIWLKNKSITNTYFIYLVDGCEEMMDGFAFKL